MRSDEQALEILENYFNCFQIETAQCRLLCDDCPFNVSDEDIEEAMYIAVEALKFKIKLQKEEA